MSQKSAYSKLNHTDTFKLCPLSLRNNNAVYHHAFPYIYILLMAKWTNIASLCMVLEIFSCGEISANASWSLFPTEQNAIENKTIQVKASVLRNWHWVQAKVIPAVNLPVWSLAIKFHRKTLSQSTSRLLFTTPNHLRWLMQLSRKVFLRWKASGEAHRHRHQ